MKEKLLSLLLLITQAVSAQLVIAPGSQLSIVGNIQLTLQDMDLVNNGNFTAVNGMVSFTGNNTNTIGGNQSTQFFQLEMNKQSGRLLRLQRTILVSNRLLFTSGFLDLNGFDTDLGNSGHLDGEQENSRVIGAIGGAVLFNMNLNAPTNLNPANLGVLITSNQDLGNVIIKRGHQSQAIQGAPNGILRYFDILPANNVSLNATLRFKYFNGELNGLDENQLGYYRRSTDSVNWSALSFNARDTLSNFVERSGIVSFSRFTLSGNFSSPLPVHFSLFNVRCDADKVMIAWKTAQEQNSHHFNVERSTDAINWIAIGVQTAAGNSTSEKSYGYVDNTPMENSYYRIAEYAMDGSKQYSGVLRSNCSVTEMFAVWPNPSHAQVYVNIVSISESSATIKLFDSKGALVKIQRTTIMKGSNQLRLDLTSLPPGAYSLYAEWLEGQMKKVVQLLKQ